MTIAYDNADRRTSLTLPNGIVVEYAYDDDSRLTGLTYKQGMSTLGTLTYGYDVNGQRTSVGGTYARTGLPAALASATYDDANQIATFGGTSFSYDDNGNLTSDGSAELHVERAERAVAPHGSGQRQLCVRRVRAAAQQDHRRDDDAVSVRRAQPGAGAERAGRRPRIC